MQYAVKMLLSRAASAVVILGSIAETIKLNTKCDILTQSKIALLIYHLLQILVVLKVGGRGGKNSEHNSR